jgi:hypothetical protein
MFSCRWDSLDAAMKCIPEVVGLGESEGFERLWFCSGFAMPMTGMLCVEQ